MTTNDIRTRYLNYFADRGHVVLPSASLLPENDPTTLFTGSGMQPMVPYLLGEKHPGGTRLTDSQKCFRAQDIEEVGDNRHTTFFEMLGNWSLGDYFKAEQIPWMFNFLIEEMGLNPENLYITCFKGNEALGIPRDTVSAELWQGLFKAKGLSAGIEAEPEQVGIREGARIFYYDETKNWWSRNGVTANMPVGEPGGPDTEMFWDFGAELNLHERSAWRNEPCHVNCDCGRFLEIGNNVFMEYKKVSQRDFEKLAKQNVDFGGGLERIAAAFNHDPDVFKIDLFDNARALLEKISAKKYGVNEEETYAFRVILDHVRAATFLIADTAYPSNKDQGYFTRRLIRRAVRYAHKLGIQSEFCSEIAGGFIETYQEAYPKLVEVKEKLLEEMVKEEKKFKRTLEKGLQELEKIFNRIELFSANEDGHISEIRDFGDYDNLGEEFFSLYSTCGYPPELSIEILDEKRKSLSLQKLPESEKKKIMEGFNAEKEKHQALSRTGAEKKFKGGLADHSEMSVKYHTATHLLHAATIKILGPHATQKGSNITPERLRFDFAHPTKPTPEELQRIEDLVNAAIERDYSVSFAIIPIAEAKQKRAIGLFEESYDDKVKVYTVGDPEQVADADPSAPTFSREFCGGPHVEHTGVLGHFKITKEEGISAGVRRIKAILE